MSVIKTPSGAKLIDILHVLRSETQPIDGHPDPGAIEDCWNEVFETIESKHTDQTEVQRLRAALEMAQSELRWGDPTNAIERVERIIDEALSTTTEPTNKYFGAERPKAEGDGNE